MTRFRRESAQWVEYDVAPSRLPGMDAICGATPGLRRRIPVHVRLRRAPGEERTGEGIDVSGNRIGTGAAKRAGEVWKPVYCYQCVAGPDLMKVQVEDGVATRIRSNFDASDDHPGGGRVCVKAYGLIQKTYNPHRVRQPMKRTNPRKGRGEDPGFVPVGWDEALDAIAARMLDIRSRGLVDESGFPRLAVSFGGGGTPTQYMGTLPAFLSAWGPIDMGFGAGQGVKCYHSEHLYGELWHRAFIVAPDTPRCRYVISCGNNAEASAGVVGVWRQADARARGLKRVQVEPHLSVTGAVSAEWVPVRPKTDAAFLYALLHRIVHERGWREVCDVAFLEDSTNAPYLVGPNGYYLRDPASRKPLLWDVEAERAVPFDEMDGWRPGPRRSPGRGRRGRGAGRRGVVARGGGGSSRVPALPRPRARAHPGVGAKPRATCRRQPPAASPTSTSPTPASARPSRSRAASCPSAPSRCSSARA